MRIFFKLNNHKGGYNQVAYYHEQAPHNHVDWLASNEDSLGKELFVCSNQFGVSNGHFQQPKKGDLLVIFQNVYLRPRVVTHVVQFLDDDVEMFSSLFPHLPATVASFDQWPYCRHTRILIQLKSTAFGGKKHPARPDLIATSTPANPICIEQLTNDQHTIGNGRIYETYGSHQQITWERIQQHLLENDDYDVHTDVALFCEGSVTFGLMGISNNIINKLTPLGQKILEQFQPEQSTFTQQVQVLTDKAFVVDEPFTVTVEFAASKESVSIPSNNQQVQQGSFSIKNDLSPKVEVSIQSSEFFFTNNTIQEVHLIPNRTHRVKFTGKMHHEANFQRGDLLVLVHYRHRIIYECTLTLIKESQDNTFTISQPQAHQLYQDIFADVDKEYNRLQTIIDKQPAPQLPYVLDVIYHDVINRTDVIEQAGNIPFALEHFFRYYLSILYADTNLEPWNIKGNLTLGILRHAFQNILDNKRTRSLKGKISNFKTYQDSLYTNIIASLVTHRNKHWGHSETGFATKTDCQRYVQKYLPLLRCLFLALHEDFPHILVVKTPSELLYFPHEYDGEIPTPPKDGTFLYLIHQQKMLPTLMQWQECSFCNQSHLMFDLPGTAPLPVLGACKQI